MVLRGLSICSLKRHPKSQLLLLTRKAYSQTFLLLKHRLKTSHDLEKVALQPIIQQKKTHKILIKHSLFGILCIRAGQNLFQYRSFHISITI